jgi:ABC-type Fe3+/spermidine/putrescine transport system ATPase subunit
VPERGEIMIDGEDVTLVPPNRRRVGLAFQNYALFPHLTVFENVA